MKKRREAGKRTLEVQKKIKKVIKSRRKEKRLFFFGFSFCAQKENAQNKWRAWNEYRHVSNPAREILGCFHAPLFCRQSRCGELRCCVV